MGNATNLDVLQAAVTVLQAGQRAALLTVISATGSTPRRAGAKMLVRVDGTVVGTIGGGTLEERAISDARQALAAGTWCMRHYEFRGKGEDSVGLCGGAMDVTIDVLVPAGRLVLIGAGHIAQPLAAMATVLGMDVVVVDDRAAWATKERFPTSTGIYLVTYDRSQETLAELPVEITLETAVVVATWGWDEPALRQVLQTPAHYIGLVASRRKLALIRQSLLQTGVPPEQVQRIRAPAGLDLGAETPAEIALSILAEIQMERGRGTGRPLSSLPKGSNPAEG